MRRRVRIAAALLLPALWTGTAGSAAAQEAAGATGPGQEASAAVQDAGSEAAGSATADTAEAPREERPMARAPADFAVAPTLAWTIWDRHAGSAVVEDGLLAGADLGSRASRFLAFRLLLAYGSARISGPDGSATARQFLAELSAVGRAAFDPFRRFGVVPFVDAGVGTLAHDPVPEELITRSQTVLSWGAGADVALGRGSPFGLRVEWRRAEVQLENLFVTREREAVGRTVDRVMGCFYLRL